MPARLGQHFLSDGAAADDIVALADIAAAAPVLEIGPGKGVLTQRLLKKSGDVTAVELDESLAERLKEKFRDSPHLRLIRADFLKLDLGELRRSAPFTIIGNLPYAVASPILRKILDWKGWDVAVLMFQKEVAERIVAGPGSRKYGVLSILAAIKSEAQAALPVPSRFFSPPPQVDSLVVKFRRRSVPGLPAEVTEEKFLKVVFAAFGQRRKTILNALAHNLGVGKAAAQAALLKSGIPAGCRAETVSLEGYIALTRCFETYL